MKQIKTVVYPIEYAHRYDKEINGLLADGWEIKKRNVMSVKGEPNEVGSAAITQALYAELERYTKPYPEEVTL